MAIFYVATPADGGNDANPGTLAQPWATWGKAFNDASVNPGDTVYFRGGIYYKAWGEGAYYHADGKSYRIDNGGTVGNYVYYWAYPPDFAAGNIPILDSSNIVPTTNTNYAIRGGANYTHFKGLHIRSVYSIEGGIGGASVQCTGWKIGGNTGMIIENCKIYDIHGQGFSPDGTQGLTLINCDAYDCIDLWAIAPQLPGNRGTGFSIANTNSTTGSMSLEGCRAWNCGDQGFSLASYGYISANRCWSFNNGKLQGGGHGFKISYWNLALPYTGDTLKRTVTNCIAAYNRETGMTTNDNIEHYPHHMHIYNNTIYHTGDPTYGSGGYGIYVYKTKDNNQTWEELREFRNNICYDSELGAIYVAPDAYYTHEHNSWDVGAPTIDATDFVSLGGTDEENITLLSSARATDGSLPNLNGFLHIAEGSDLIGSGIDLSIPADGDGNPWSIPPSIGAFEFDAEELTPPEVAIDSHDSNHLWIFGPTPGQTGKLGSAFTFTTDDYLGDLTSRVPTLELTDDMSISAWFKTNIADGVPHTLVSNYNAGYGYYLGLDASYRLEFFVGDGTLNGTKTTAASYNNNAWHHVVATYDGLNILLYVDGVIIGGAPATFTAPIAYDANVRFLIGARQAGGVGERFWEGTIDEVGVWNRVLSETWLDVTELYNGGVGLTYPF